MNIVPRMKRVIGASLKSPGAYRLALLGLSRIPGRRSVGAGHILICPPGNGNLGDQALVEAFIENVVGEVTLVMRSPGDFRIPHEFRRRVRVVASQGAVYGRLPFNIVDAARLAKLIRAAESLSICGADIMDGAYNYRASANRASIAEAAARRAVQTRVLGFSWNDSPHPVALRQLKRAGLAGVVLYLRDPRSVSRALADGLTRVRESADIVFSATTVDDTIALEAIGRFDEQGRPIAIINVSGLINKAQDLSAEYVEVVSDLARTHNVLLLPHVVKPDSDDAQACRDVANAVDSRLPVQVVNDELTPSLVRGFCSHADVIVTGRMHLAVNGLHQGKRPVALATQGKVEGLMELFDAANLCVVPQPGMAERIFDALEGSVQSGSTEQLARVKELSAVNFTGLRRLAGERRER